MNTTIYLINKSLIVALNGDVLEKVWRGKKVFYDHLRMFGCWVFLHVPKDEHHKLEDKAK